MSICDGCIHDDVCGLEDNHEEGIVSCADMIPKDVLDNIRAEIEENAYPIVHGVNNHEKGMTLYGILQVIDKYKADMRGTK